MGLEGLRKAKMSYNPADFARKYLVEQLLDGQKSYKWAEEIENTASENLPEYLPQEEKKETIPLWKACFRKIQTAIWTIITRRRQKITGSWQRKKTERSSPCSTGTPIRFI